MRKHRLKYLYSLIKLDLGSWTRGVIYSRGCLIPSRARFNAGITTTTKACRRGCLEFLLRALPRCNQHFSRSIPLFSKRRGNDCLWTNCLCGNKISFRLRIYRLFKSRLIDSILFHFFYITTFISPLSIDVVCICRKIIKVYKYHTNSKEYLYISTTFPFPLNLQITNNRTLESLPCRISQNQSSISSTIFSRAIYLTIDRCRIPSLPVPRNTESAIPLLPLLFSPPPRRLIRFTETPDKISLKFHRGICFTGNVRTRSPTFIRPLTHDNAVSAEG